jgi:hypothetical protein
VAERYEISLAARLVERIKEIASVGGVLRWMPLPPQIVRRTPRPWSGATAAQGD